MTRLPFCLDSFRYVFSDFPSAAMLRDFPLVPPFLRVAPHLVDPTPSSVQYVAKSAALAIVLMVFEFSHFFSPHLCPLFLLLVVTAFLSL
jgi:hypothetical protein